MGVNRVERADGSSVPLSHIGSTAVAAGDTFVIEPPGGGGYGSTNTRARGKGLPE
jgi:5-oxoprolinase (ATP-hydrolysing)